MTGPAPRAPAHGAPAQAGAHAHPHALAGILLVVAACACFAALDTTTKFVSATVPMVMALWVRYVLQAVGTTLAVLPQRGMSIWRTRHLPYQLLRGLLLIGTSLLAFISLRYLPVGEFTAIVMISPLAITLFAAAWMKERVSVLRWALVAGGFAGTLIIIRPGGQTFSWASLLPVGLVVLNAWFQLLTSKLARTEDPITMHLYTGWVGAAVTSVLLPFAWTALPSGWLWLALAFMGVMGTVGHFLLILAYQRAPASTLTPFLYAQIAFAITGGLLVFGHIPDAPALLGSALIAVCGAGAAWLAIRERRA